ncbi:hypothetical protein HT118_02200 [Escherichia coli]|nr:hypothetical protein [Escherichia coli]
MLVVKFVMAIHHLLKKDGLTLATNKTILTRQFPIPRGAFQCYFYSSANDTFFRKQARVLHVLYPADIPLSTALF